MKLPATWPFWALLGALCVIGVTNTLAPKPPLQSQRIQAVNVVRTVTQPR